MSSTFSSLKFELIANGEQSGLWGTTTNANIGTAIEQAIVGMATLDSGDFTANVATLTLSDTTAAQDARALCLNIAAGAVSAAGTINVPAIQKPYIIINGSSFAVTVKVSGQTGVAVPAGKRTVVYNNGTDVGDQINWLASLETSGITLSGGTANGVAYLNGGKVLTTGGPLVFDGARFAVNGSDPTVGSGQMVVQSANENGVVVNNTNAAQNATLFLRDTAGTNPARIKYNSANTGLSFVDSSNNEQMLLNGSGLQIGTTGYHNNSFVTAFAGFTASGQGSMTPPCFQTYYPAAPVNKRYWKVAGTASGTMSFQSTNDAYTISTEWLSIDTNGNVLVRGGAGGGLGYGLGNGGSVTQLTDKSTAVTLNKICGQITMSNSLLSNGNNVLFTLNNTTIAATDVVLVSTAGFAGYAISTGNVVAGSCQIVLSNRSGMNLSEAVKINFAVFKATPFFS